MLDSEEMEMTDMKTEKSLLDDMLSEENLSPGISAGREKQGGRGSGWYEIYRTQGLPEGTRR